MVILYHLMYSAIEKQQQQQQQQPQPVACSEFCSTFIVHFLKEPNPIRLDGFSQLLPFLTKKPAKQFWENPRPRTFPKTNKDGLEDEDVSFFDAMGFPLNGHC